MAPLHPTPVTHTAVVSYRDVRVQVHTGSFQPAFCVDMWELLWRHTVLSVYTAALDEYALYVIQKLKNLICI